MNIHRKRLFLTATLALLAAFLISTIKTSGIPSKAVFGWGNNQDGDCGFKSELIGGTISTPIQSNTLKQYIIDPVTSWKAATGVNASDVSANLRHAVSGHSLNMFVMDYTNTTDGSWLGQKIFVSGSNQNGQAAIVGPPYLMTEPVLIYAYEDAGKSSNPLASRNVTQLACEFSCIALTSDGMVFYHQGESSGNGDWTTVNLPTSITDPDSGNPIQNMTYTMIAIGGNYNSQTYFALSNYVCVFITVD